MGCTKVFILIVPFTTGSIFELGSLLCATAPTSTAFVIARAVCGLGMAGISAGCFTLLVQLIPLRKRPVYTGVLGSIEGLSGIVAPILGGVCTCSATAISRDTPLIVA